MRSSLRRNRRALVLAATAVTGLIISANQSLAQTSGTWAVDVGAAGGNWSSTTNWLGGVVPDNGGTATFVTLPFTTAPVTIIQDSPTVTLSGLTFDSFITYLIRPPTGNTTNTLTLTGPATINTPRQSINTLSTTVFGHLFQIGIAGSAGLVKTGPGTATLWNSGGNTYTGGTSVNGGILVARQFGDALFGDPSGSISINDGTIRVTTSAWTSSRTINLLGAATIEASTTGTTTFNGPVIGSGALNKLGSRGLVLTATNSYTGPTTIWAGSIGLSGNGALGSTSSITSRDSIVLDNFTTNLNDRINDAAPITLMGATMSLIGNVNAVTNETLGPTTLSRGTTQISLAEASPQRTSITTGPISRELGAMAYFKGNNLGTVPASGSNNIYFPSSPALIGGGGAAGTADVSIIPWALGNNSAGTLGSATNTFVTYGTDGVRPLSLVSEYATSFAAAAPTNNVRLITGDTAGAGKTINSLIIAGGNGSILGVGNLTITSGALMNYVNVTRIDCGVDFGPAEGMVFAPINMTFAGPISGSGGVTKQGAGIATFSNATSTYTGTTTIGGGSVIFSADVPSGAPSPFGNSTSAIVLAPAGLGTGNTTARLLYIGAGSGTFSRDLLVSGRIALNNAATLPGFGVGLATMTMNGNITLDDSPLNLITASSGASSLTINGNITGNGLVTDQSGLGFITLKGNNTFTGGVEMSGATWEVGSDSAFGTGLLKMVQLSGSPTIRSVGGAHMVPNDAVSFSFGTTYWTIGGSNDITFTGDINLSGSYIHNITNTGLTTYAGVLHTGGFTKGGPGTLVLSGNNTYTGVTTISGGTLRVTSPNGLGSPLAGTILPKSLLELGAAALTSEPVSIGGEFGAGALRSLGGATSVGNVTLVDAATIGADSGSLTSGAIAGNFRLGKVGAGTLRAQSVRVGSLTISSGTLAIIPGRSNSKTSSITSLTFSAGTTLDLGDNDLVIDYTAPSPINSVRTNLSTGQLTSSVAAANPGRALGYGEASIVLGAGGGTFSGMTVDATAVLVGYTYSGDSNLDGMVDVTDLGNLAGNWQTSNVWTGGDFNYDGFVDVTDLGALATNWQAGVNPPLAPSRFDEALAAVGLRGVTVPEPAVISIVAISALALRRRRAIERI